jgi:hypothetical protein
MDNRPIIYKDFYMKKLPGNIQFKAEESHEKIVNEIAKRERRPVGAVARAIFERGLAAYARDGNIFEPGEVNAERILAELKADSEDTDLPLKKKRA